jgi:hypothetical protein
LPETEPNPTEHPPDFPEVREVTQREAGSIILVIDELPVIIEKPVGEGAG